VEKGAGLLPEWWEVVSGGVGAGRSVSAAPSFRQQARETRLRPSWKPTLYLHEGRPRWGPPPSTSAVSPRFDLTDARAQSLRHA